MRNVTRTERPACLTTHGRRWTKEYLEAVATGDKDLIGRRRKKYNHPEVRSELDAMYRNLCCYCESQVGPVRADQIEHRMPVDDFPGRAFDWVNLHLACGGCNGLKSNKWNASHSILDAVKDVPITRHLGYESRASGVRRVGLTRRGRTTVSHTKLNREKLREARDTTMLEAVGLIIEIRERIAKDPDDPLAANRLEELEERYEGPYGSMIRWAVSTLL